MRSVPWLTWTNIPSTLLAVVDEGNNLDHRASTIKIAHTTGADAETYEKRKAEQERSARRCLVFYRDRSTDNAGGGVLKILEPSRGWAHLIGSAPRQATELSPGAPVEYRVGGSAG